MGTTVYEVGSPSKGLFHRHRFRRQFGLAGETSEWDAVIDNSVTANPQSPTPVYNTINEALNAISSANDTNGRAWILVRHTGSTYTETDALNAPNLTNVRITGHVTRSQLGPGSVRWTITEDYVFNSFRLENLAIEHSTGVDRTFSGTEMLVNTVNFAVGGFSVTGTLLYMENCNVSGGSTVQCTDLVGQLVSCELNQVTVVADNAKIGVDVTVHGSATFSGTGRIDGNVGRAIHQRNVSGSGNATVTVSSTGYDLSFSESDKSSGGKLDVIVDGGAGVIRGASTSTTCEVRSGAVSLVGVWAWIWVNGTSRGTLDVVVGGTARSRFESSRGWSGSIAGTSGSPSPWLDFTGSSENVLVVHGRGNGTGGEQPFRFDASSNRNTLIWRGLQTYGGAGVDNGMDNWIITGPGGGLGGANEMSPASTVEDETLLGVDPAVGTDLAYARQNHTHGTPDYGLVALYGGG